MGEETNIKVVAEDPNSLFKCQRVKVSSSKSFLTPGKVVDLAKIKLKYNIDKNLKQNVELFRRVNSISLKNYEDDPNVENDFNSRIQTDINKIQNEDSSKLLFIEFDEKRLPTVDELETITDISHSYSDMVSIPVLSFLNNRKIEDPEFRRYEKFLEEALESLKQLNNKPIMGIIPKIASSLVVKVIDFYLKESINSFAVDLGGSNPMTSLPKIRRILKTINKSKPLEDCYIHAYNMGIGRMNKATSVVPARDILGLGVGFGTIGDKHKKFTPNRAFIEYIKSNPEHKYRFFNKDDYGYWHGLSADRLKMMLPEDTRIDMKMFRELGNKWFFQRLLNTEQLAKEAVRLRKIITEDPEKSLNYIKSKKQVDVSDYKKILKAKEKI